MPLQPGDTHMCCRKRFLSLAFSFFLVLLSGITALAQFGATLQGTVQDKSGAKIAGAKVAVTDQATGVTKEVTTSPDGFYRLGEIPPGRYTVTVDAPGFKHQVTKDVEVAAESP